MFVWNSVQLISLFSYVYKVHFTLISATSVALTKISFPRPNTNNFHESIQFHYKGLTLWESSWEKVARCYPYNPTATGSKKSPFKASGKHRILGDSFLMRFWRVISPHVVFSDQSCLELDMLFCISYIVQYQIIKVISKDFSLQELVCPRKTLLWTIGLSLSKFIFWSYLGLILSVVFIYLFIWQSYLDLFRIKGIYLLLQLFCMQLSFLL